MKRSLSSVVAVSTSHGSGWKKVLLSSSETMSAITQIAVTRLSEGNRVEEHSHPSMEECFFVHSGKLRICVGGDVEELVAGDFIRVAAGETHDMLVMEDSEVLTIGCAVLCDETSKKK